MTGYTPKYVPEIEKLLEGLSSADDKKRLNATKLFLDSLPDEIVLEAKSKIEEKDQLRRMKLQADLINEAIVSNNPIISGNDLNDEIDQFKQLLKHVKNLWNESANMLRKGNYPISIFLALVCIEESAKITIARMQIAINETNRKSNSNSNKSTITKKGRSPVYSHPKKHTIAALAGTLVNSRADNRLGMKRINEFIEMAEKGKIENLRQSCLYADRRNNSLKIPFEIHDGKSAVFYVALAGEILAECDVVFWESHIKDLDAFEAEYLVTNKNKLT